MPPPSRYADLNQYDTDDDFASSDDHDDSQYYTLNGNSGKKSDLLILDSIWVYLKLFQLIFLRG